MNQVLECHGEGFGREMLVGEGWCEDWKSDLRKRRGLNWILLREIGWRGGSNGRIGLRTVVP